jgi:FkbH-like protein
MTTRDDLLAALLRVLPDEPNIAVIHSSISQLMPPQDFTRWDAIYALGMLVQRGWTVALPAFTFSFCGGKPFSARHSKSETGVLADWLREHMPEALRTPHPIYSFAVLGPRAAEIAACACTTTFGDDSPFGLFERAGATDVMLGCGWIYNTQFHRYEELARVPYRHIKVFEGSADFGAGAKPTQAAMWVRHLAANPINDFSPAFDRLRAEGLIASAALWRGSVEAAAIRDIAATCRADLSRDPYAYVSNGAAAARVLAQESEAKTQPPVRIAVLGGSNLHLLERSWQEQLAQLLPERRVELQSLPFGQMQRELIDPGSALRRFAPNVRIFCDRLEDVAGDDWQDAERVAEQVADYAAMIAGAHQAMGGWTVVHRFAVLTPAADNESLHLAAAIVARMNGLLDEKLAALPQLVWVDLGAEAASFDGAALDPRLWHVGRFVFTEGFSRHLARSWAGMTLAMLGKTARVVVTDLDNTLWGGVLGEVGLSGLKIGGDYPGNAYAAFQRALKVLSRRGIALAVSSKNDEDLALRAIDELPSMVLRSGDFVARRINWQPKWQGIRDIAEELNLGLESVLFIDDNPIEREAVRRNLPGVKVLDLPPDPALYASALLASPYVAAVTVTEEDRKRVDAFKAQKARQAERGRAASLEDYYASLGMILHFAPLDVGNAQRAAQLAQKTTQFNTTTRRYELRSLEQMAETGTDVVVIGLEDRHSPYENIGLLVLRPDGNGVGAVDLYLLSCRVLGRGIETAILHWAVARAARRGWAQLRGEIIETERNTPVRAVFAEAGFAAASPGAWTIPSHPQPALPGWLSIIDTLTGR